MLKASAPSRVVTVSAKINVFFRTVLDPDDLNFEKIEYSGQTAYAYSKTANILFSAELGRRLEGKKTHKSCVPAMITACGAAPVDQGQ